MYTISIHLMYTFCISNLEQLEVYKRYTSQKKKPINTLADFVTRKHHKKYTFCIHIHKVYLLQDWGLCQCCWHQGIHFVYLCIIWRNTIAIANTNVIITDCWQKFIFILNWNHTLRFKIMWNKNNVQKCCSIQEYHTNFTNYNNSTCITIAGSKETILQ